MTPIPKLNLPLGPGLPPPPPMERDAFVEYWLWRMGEFCRSPHFEEWERRTAEEMREAKPFVLRAAAPNGLARAA